MSPINPSFPLLCFLVLLTLSHVSAAPPNFLYTYCPTTKTTTLSSTDRTQINSLLSDLSSSANLSSTPSFNYLTSPSSSFHALYLCRGDLDSSTCRDCVAAASTDLPNNCPTGTQAVIWYDECKVRYSNASFFGRVDVNFQLQLMNTLNVTTNVTGFNHVLDETLKKVAAKAAKGGSDKKFATKEVKFNEFQTLYTLAQCTPDLSTADCSTCLEASFNVISDGYRQGWRVMFFSCTLHYEIYKFYRTPVVDHAA